MGSREGWAEDRTSAGWRGAAWHMCAHACPCPVRGSPGLAWETQRRSPRVGEPRTPSHGPLPALTVSRRHLFSLMAPMQPTKPMAMTRVPVTMSRLAADREGKEEDRVAKFPCVAASQMPTPRMPQPPSWDQQGRERGGQVPSACPAPRDSRPRSRQSPEAARVASRAPRPAPLTSQGRVPLPVLFRVTPRLVPHINPSPCQ